MRVPNGLDLSGRQVRFLGSARSGDLRIRLIALGSVPLGFRKVGTNQMGVPRLFHSFSPKLLFDMSTFLRGCGGYCRGSFRLQEQPRK